MNCKKCTVGHINLRPFVRWVAGQLELTLRKNESGNSEKRRKGPWEMESPQILQSKVVEEYDEMIEAFGQCAPGEKRNRERIDHLIGECFDLIAAAGQLAASQDTEMSQLRRGRLP